MGDVRVIRSLDAELGLDTEAVCAVSRWRFRPATLNGAPVPFVAQVIMEFRLH